MELILIFFNLYENENEKINYQDHKTMQEGLLVTFM